MQKKVDIASLPNPIKFLHLMLEPEIVLFDKFLLA